MKFAKLTVVILCGKVPTQLVFFTLLSNYSYGIINTYAQEVLADEPVAYYRFEDSTTNNLDTAYNSGTSGSVLDGEYKGNNFSQIHHL